MIHVASSFHNLRPTQTFFLAAPKVFVVTSFLSQNLYLVYPEHHPQGFPNDSEISSSIVNHGPNFQQEENDSTISIVAIVVAVG